MTTEKEMEKKYYTPEIEEFHIGFECETLERDSWKKVEIYDVSFEIDTEELKQKKIRVKYLDKEDIESIGGWEFVKEYKDPGSYCLDFKKRHTELTLHPALEETMIFIEHGSDISIGYPVFKGKIKNKSELKTLLKQLGI